MPGGALYLSCRMRLRTLRTALLEAAEKYGVPQSRNFSYNEGVLMKKRKCRYLSLEVTLMLRHHIQTVTIYANPIPVDGLQEACQEWEIIRNP